MRFQRSQDTPAPNKAQFKPSNLTIFLIKIGLGNSDTAICYSTASCSYKNLLHLIQLSGHGCVSDASQRRLI